MQQVQQQQEKLLSVAQALEIAARHGVTIHAKPIITKSWNGRFGKGIKLFLPGYIVSIEVDMNGKETVEIKPSSDCFCNCDCSGPSDDLVW